MIKGFTETDTNVKTPKDVNITEEPLKSDPINTDRVDINVLKAKLEKKESQEFKKNFYILSALVAGLAIMGIYFSL
jgi:hypothetical protein|tara:strand:- start:148 stop:375 length:228 start_codon:yes stop_codon:yes gene_type:complete